MANLHPPKKHKKTMSMMSIAVSRCVQQFFSTPQVLEDFLKDPIGELLAYSCVVGCRGSPSKGSGFTEARMTHQETLRFDHWMIKKQGSNHQEIWISSGTIKKYGFDLEKQNNLVI